MSKYRLLIIATIIILGLSASMTLMPVPSMSASGETTFESSPYDGFQALEGDYHVTEAAAWNEAHDTASAGWQDYAGTNARVYVHARESGGEYRATVERAYLYFDTSSLPDDATITSATIQLYVYEKAADLTGGGTDFILQTGGATYPHVPMVVSDFLYTHWSGDCGQKSYSSISTGQYNTWTLTSTGRSAISTTGYTKFVLREEFADENDNQPAFNPAPGLSNYIRFYTYEQGSGYRPKLTVTYTYTAVPTVTTAACTDIGGTSMTANGEVTDSDDLDIIRRGFTYMEGDSGDPADVIEVLNPSFESGNPPDDWSASRCTLTQEGSIKVSGYGSYSSKVTGTATVGQAYAYQNIPNWENYTGETITLGVWVWAPSAAGQDTQITIWDAVSSATTVCTQDDSWHFATVTKTIDEGASQLWLMLRVRDSGSTAEYAYFDGAILIHDDEILAVYEDDAFGEGEFDLEISGLDNDTSYRVRAFAQSEAGIGYGSSVTGTTLDEPAITTLDASNVASTSVKLNSALSDDGGGDCTIKFGWGLTSEAAIEDYDSYQTLAGTYNTGQYPYLDVSGLLPGYTYYFRVSATNDVGTTLGAELTFETESGLSAPTNFVGYPESTSISLSWSKGVGSTNTMVRYGTSAYPATNTSGILAYFGPSSTYTVESLTSGKTYYFSAWGESGGNYSAGYATLLMTTSASTGDDDDDIDIPTQPSRWFSAPDYTTMSGLGLVYDGYNSALDLGHVPRETGWFLGAILLSAILGLVAYLKFGKKMMIGMIVLTVCLAMGYFLQLIPWWIPLMTLILTIVWSQTHKQVVHG